MTRARSTAPLTLEAPVSALSGVGAGLAGRLRQLGIERVLDLLLHLPLRYEDRSRLTPVAGLSHNQPAQMALEVRSLDQRSQPRRQLRVLCVDAAGEPLLLRFFHFRNAQAAGFRSGSGLRVWGTARLGSGGWEMVHPEYRHFGGRDAVAPEGGLRAVYPLTAGLSQARLRSLVGQALDLAAAVGDLSLPVPGLDQGAAADETAAEAVPSALEALRLLHRPPDSATALRLREGSHPAQRRLIEEELLAHQCSLRLIRQRVQRATAPRIGGMDGARRQLLEQLGFALTGAQQRVITEIGGDMAAGAPMLRLVQGDVGSGKTVVAAAALLAAARAGWQAVLMAPTELLAEQHARTLASWLTPLGLPPLLLTGRMKEAERRAAAESLADGRSRIAVGTHAVFQTQVRFSKLGLVVVDEQHRFGVGQRLALRDKGGDAMRPHQLVMTATPIPRTLAQTAYADLDLSLIDELPPGRTPVQTAAVANGRRPEVVERLRAALAEGRQVYWVCTLIEDSEQLAAQAAEEIAESLTAALPTARVGLVHGRLKAAEKQQRMAAFAAGDIEVLVATTVIEVGVDVPNASIMVIENAERLGLSQLHQLRGRVGRGHRASQCLLLYQPPLGELAKQRLEVMRTTHSGFVIAEKDLELRGPGELLGRRQTGVVGLKVADPIRDAAALPRVLPLADRLVREDPALAERLVARWVGDVQRYGTV